MKKRLVLLVLLFTASTAVKGEEPSSIAAPTAEAISSNRGYLGYTTRYEEGPDDLGRIRVLEIHPGGPAERAELRRGDVVVSINERAFRFAHDLDMVRQLSWIEAGTEVRLKLLRGSRILEKTLVAEPLPEAMRLRLEAWVSAAEDWYEKGGGESCRAKKAAANPD